MSATPPPIPKRRLPALPKAARKNADDFFAARSRVLAVRGWLALAMLSGVAAGCAKGAWRAIADNDPVYAESSCGVLLFAGFGIAGISYSVWHLVRRPTLEKFLGMKRSYWLPGIVLSWLCGVVMGLLWRFV